MDRRQLLKVATVASAGIALSSTAFMVGCDSSWINTALNDLPTIEAIVGSLVSIVALGDPALSPAVSAAINIAFETIKAGLVTVQALVSDYKVSSSASVIGKIDAALTDLQTNLSQVLQLAQIKNAALQATIATGIALAISVVSTIQLLIPAQVAATRGAALNVTVDRAVAKQAIPQKIKVVDSNTVKLMYNVVASSAGYSLQVVK